MEKYSHRERLQMIFAGERPDRFAASFWRHFFDMEHHAQGTVEAMVGFQKTFDWDFMKINPRADYHAQDWGLHLDYSHHEFRKHAKSSFPVEKPEDWSKIKPLPLDSPVLAEHLQVVSMIRKAVGDDLPVLMTVFSPLAVAGRLVADQQTVVNHLREYPDAFVPALEAITDTYARFSVELRNAGADGLFFATTQWASEGMITWEEYQKFGIPYDLKVVEASQEDAINLFHVCSSQNYLKQLVEIDYKSQMYNWASEDPTNSPIDRAYEFMQGKTIVGGVDQNGWLLHSDPDEIANKMHEIKKEHAPERLILGPGCSMPPETSMDNLKVIRELL